MSPKPNIRLVPDPAQADPIEALRDRPEVGRPASLAAAVEALLVDAKDAAALCGISPASWYRLKASGQTPASVKLGGSVRYRVEDLKRWVALGCPPRKEFEARRA
jgi:predicted DNA-binding transcriptional regulator AlpA